MLPRRQEVERRQDDPMPLQGPSVPPTSENALPGASSDPGDVEALDTSLTYASTPSGIQAAVGAGPLALYMSSNYVPIRNDILRCTKWVVLSP